MADQHAADRPHQITDREYAECRKQLSDCIVMREEVATNLALLNFEWVKRRVG
jgi:hypothetical protein